MVGGKQTRFDMMNMTARRFREKALHIGIKYGSKLTNDVCRTTCSEAQQQSIMSVATVNNVSDSPGWRTRCGALDVRYCCSCCEYC